MDGAVPGWVRVHLAGSRTPFIPGPRDVRTIPGGRVPPRGGRVDDCERESENMISVESWPQPAIKMWTLAQRFQKFLVVGALGFAVNQLALFGLYDVAGVAVPVASPFAILLSMMVTFYLNEIWTWHDRGSGRILFRARSYVPINLGGLAINWAILTVLHQQFDVHYLVANLVGAAVAAVWNFVLNNAITWRS